MKIIYFLDNTQQAELQLDPQKSYIVGRGSDCDIVLEKKPGISRKHFKLSFVDSVWEIEKLTDKSSLLYEGEGFEKMNLKDQDVIESQNYKFLFEEDDKKEEQKEEEVSEQKEDPQVVNSSQTQMQTMIQPNLEKAVLKVYQQDNEKSFDIKKEEVVVGRDPTSDIVISDVLMSRYHFKISKKQGKYFIEDLGSANKTKLNDKELIASTVYPLESGDSIYVMNLNMSFQILKTSILQDEISAEIKPEEVPVDAAHPPIVLSQSAASQAVLRIENKKKPNLRMIIIGIVAIGVIGFAAFNELQPKQEVKKEESKTKKNLTGNPQFDNLSEAEQSIVIESLNFAKMFLQQKNFQNCIDKITRIQEYVDKYKTSESIGKACQIGLERLRQKEEELKREEDERKKIEQINKILTECQEKIDQFETEEQARECVNPIFELDPENKDAQSIITTISLKVEKRERELEAKRERRRIRQQGLKLYNKALKSFNNKKYKKSIKEFKIFLKRKFTILKKENKDAKEKIKQAEKAIYQVVLDQIKKCKDFTENNKLKEAFHACKKAIKMDPDNKDPEKYLKQIRQIMKNKFQPVYQKSVLEEEVGNIEIAMKLWKEIISKSFPQENYYEKSKRQLKKYGVKVK